MTAPEFVPGCPGVFLQVCPPHLAGAHTPNATARNGERSIDGLWIVVFVVKLKDCANAIPYKCTQHGAEGSIL